MQNHEKVKAVVLQFQGQGRFRVAISAYIFGMAVYVCEVILFTG